MNYEKLPLNNVTSQGYPMAEWEPLLPLWFRQVEQHREIRFGVWCWRLVVSFLEPELQVVVLQFGGYRRNLGDGSLNAGGLFSMVYAAVSHLFFKVLWCMARPFSWRDASIVVLAIDEHCYDLQCNALSHVKQMIWSQLKTALRGFIVINQVIVN